MIRKYSFFINENRRSLAYAAYDWDDNLLHMGTKIHMEKKDGDSWIPVDLSTEEFAKARGDKENYRYASDAFAEFGDSGKRGSNAFLEDVKQAISKGRFAPSWSKFKQTLIDGSIFAIITARGHEPETIKN